MNHLQDTIISANKQEEYTDKAVTLYLRELKEDLLQKQEEFNLLQKIASGDQAARDRLAENNLRLVVWIAKQYLHRGLKVEFLDLIQEGNLALMEAIDHFDLTKDCSFSTYATRYIEGKIKNLYKKEDSTKMLPSNLRYEQENYRMVKQALEHSGICEPTIEEIAEKMQLTIEQVTELKKAEERNSVVSLEALISNTTNEMEVIGAVSSLETITEDAVILNQLKLNIQALLEGGLLKEREVEVLKLRFGFIDDIEKTRAEIAKKFGVTEQRICQIECRALEKLRKYPPIAEYAIYMNNPTTSLYNLETYRQLYREGKKVKLPSKASKREEPKRKNSEKYSSIYSYLEPYTPEQIDQVIRQLTDYERYLLTLRFGDDFKTPPEVRTWTIEERQAYNALTGKIKRLLRKIVVEEIKSDSNQQLSENKSDKQELSMISTEKLCDQLKEMTQTPTFQTMLTYMTPQEAMITCLKLGYLTEEYIDSARISVLLGVDETEVQGLGKVALEKYKQYIINENRNNVVKQSIKLKRVQ